MKKIFFILSMILSIQNIDAKLSEIVIGKDIVSYTLTINKTVTVQGEAQAITIDGNSVGLSRKASAFYIEAFNSIVCSTGEVFNNPHAETSSVTGTPTGLYYTNYIGSTYPKQKIKNMPGAGKRIDYFLGVPNKKAESEEKN